MNVEGLEKVLGLIVLGATASNLIVATMKGISELQDKKKKRPSSAKKKSR